MYNFRSDKLKLFIREYFTEIEKEVPDRPPAVEACQHEVSIDRSLGCGSNCEMIVREV